VVKSAENRRRDDAMAVTIPMARNLQFLELSRSEQEKQQLQNALKCDVKFRQDHAASE